MRPSPVIHLFGNSSELAKTLSARTALALADAVDRKGRALLGVSGGSTPGRFFDELSETAIDWARIVVTLVDERCVPPDHERSNARLVAQRLLTGKARDAQFLPLFDGTTEDPETAAAQAHNAIGKWLPLDVCVLGMGTDGHTASFFPGGDNLNVATDPGTGDHVVTMTAPGVPETRLTLTLPVIAGAGFLALHIEGEAKRRVFEQALEEGPAAAKPIRAVLDNVSENLEVFLAA